MPPNTPVATVRDDEVDDAFNDWYWSRERGAVQIIEARPGMVCIPINYDRNEEKKQVENYVPVHGKLVGYKVLCKCGHLATVSTKKLSYSVPVYTCRKCKAMVLVKGV